ncbi:hypothetical protein, partial [Providencia alcalifaciens]|uniref:hypothetical protein n=2 Tax=Enterobacterales TaxID=91347 RepID=UPI002AA0E1BA
PEKRIIIMSQRISITIKNESSLKAIDEYCHKNNLTRSAVIANILASACPLLNEINQHTQIVNELENQLFNPKKNSQKLWGDTPVFSLPEYLLDIWQTHIIEKGIIIDKHAYPHAYKSPKIGLKEKKTIQETLNSYIDSPYIKKAIFIYTDRHVHYKLHKAGGFSNTILIRNTEYKNYLFDFNAIIHIPIKDIVFHGIEAAFKKNQIILKESYVAFIPIYHSNNQCVLIGVIDKTQVNRKIESSPDTIIINPI